MSNRNSREREDKSQDKVPFKTTTPSLEQELYLKTASLSLDDIQLLAGTTSLSESWLPAKSSSSTQQARARTSRPTARNERTKLRSEATNVETSFIRVRSATADVTITHSGITYNHIKLTTLTFEDGTTQQKVEYPFKAESYDFVTHFTEDMSPEERVAFLNQSWVEIIVDVATNFDKSTALFAQLDSLGPEFSNNLKNLDIRVLIPEYSLIVNRGVKSLPSTPAGQYIRQVVTKVKEYEAIEHMNIVIVIPETCPQGMFDIQLAFILPFFLLKFTAWHFKYQVPSIRYPRITQTRDLGRLIEMNTNILNAMTPVKFVKAVKRK
jgi:hypothetical protein